ADDRRATVLIAPPPIRVLVVNGSPSDDFEDDEVGYLMLALEPLSGDGLGAEVRPFDAAEITVDRLTDPELHLRSYEVIVLAGLSVVTEAAVQRLEARVASGASLVIAMGPRVADLTVTNRALYRPDGSGLLPAELVRRFSVARRDSYYRVAAFEEAHPALSFFADETWRPFLQEIPIYEFVQVRPLDDARVLASLDDDGRSPLLIERPFDQGRVFLYTSSFHPSWSDMEDSPRTLIPLTHEWLRYAGTRREPPRVLSPGAPLSLVVDTYPRLTELVLPDGDRRALEGTPEELSDGRWRLPQIPGERTERAGLYIVGLDAGRSEPFAVQLDPGEGDLTRLSTLELEGLHPALQLLARSDDNSSISSEGNTRGEIWRLLATLCLACLIGESLWSAWLGQRRRIG
ncbi:MAG: hypothetical protein O2816_03680, partial [Planctomycetota bacterium]|nr:hypothetical protein [Planctomycetota bacterium]